MAGIISFKYLENTDEVIKFFNDNALSYLESQEFIINSVYGKQVATLSVEYHTQDGDRKYWVNGYSWNSEDIEALRDYVEEVYFS